MAGILVLAGMGLRIPLDGITTTIGEDGAPQLQINQTLVRLDLWPTWLEIGCVHADRAREANERLAPDMPDIEKATVLTEELQAGLVALAAFAFAFDGFYDTLRHELGPHPDQTAWRKNRTARDVQVIETLRFHIGLGPRFSEQLRTVLKELFDFRSRAVHPTSNYVEPNFRPQIDSAVHPHLLTFSGPHSVQARALVLELLDRLVSSAAKRSKPHADAGWLDRGRIEIDRLSALYRVPGDDEIAFPTGEAR